MAWMARHRWLAAAALSTGALAAWKMAAAARQRRHMLRTGAMRELHPLWLDVGGCRTHARISTAATTPAAVAVVFVHGWGISGSYFIPAAERLAAEFAVYAPDLPGHGLSDTPATLLDVDGLAEALVDWMDRAGIRCAALVGHSMGCQIAVEAALRYPGRIDRLVLIGPTPDPGARSTLEQFRRFLMGGLFERQSLNSHLLKDYTRMGRRLAPEFRAMMRDPIEDKLPQLNVPTMLVRGERDAIVPQPWLDEAARLLSTDRTAVIPGWGHAVQYSAAGQLVDAIRPFLREASTCGATGRASLPAGARTAASAPSRTPVAGPLAEPTDYR